MEENKKEGNTRRSGSVATASESATTKVSENKQGGGQARTTK